MTEDVYEPLARYRDEFKAKFHDLAVAKFQELTDASGVDVAANRKLVREIRALEARAARARRRSAWALAGIVLGFLGAAGVAAFCCLAEGEPWRNPWVSGAGAASLLLGILCIGPFRRAQSRLFALTEEIRVKTDLAWRQMAPLNALYTWDVTTRLIEATVPRLQFDPYFAARRLDDLKRLYGWDDAYNKGKSVLFAQSGVINGNPFVFGDCLEQGWTTETYHGSLSISWTEIEDDAEGRPRRVTRHETLHASVSKPKPSYDTRTFLLYGNDAAPNLRFTREPSDLSDAGGGLFKSLRLHFATRKLKAFSRNLKDESQYTLMGNHEFEVLFQTMDRTNEVEYRLLFTPVAQLQMLALLKDRSVGYGDDFRFVKRDKINLVFAAHLDRFPLDTDPARFADWDWDAARGRFLDFNDTYFKNVYFGLAPLLAIPLYQQTRTHEEIWKDVLGPHEGASFWEHEALANYHGEDAFRHPDCITRSILKTELRARTDGTSRVMVTAHGFRGEPRTDYVSVYGGDGHYHDVPVEWTEYLPVARAREVSVREGVRPDRPLTPAEAVRRAIYSSLA